MTSQRILEVALEQFYDRGYHATTMRDIAGGVGIKAGSLYNHYASKQEILLRVCMETCQRLYQGALERLAGIDGTEERLRAYLRWHVLFHTRNQHACWATDTQLMALEDGNRSAVVKIRDAHEQLLLEILEQGAREGLWSSAHLKVLAIGIATMCTDVDVWYRDDGPLEPDQIADIFADFVRYGLSGSPRRPAARGRERR